MHPKPNPALVLSWAPISPPPSGAPGHHHRAPQHRGKCTTSSVCTAQQETHEHKHAHTTHITYTSRSKNTTHTAKHAQQTQHKHTHTHTETEVLPTASSHRAVSPGKKSQQQQYLSVPFAAIASAPRCNSQRPGVSCPASKSLDEGPGLPLTTHYTQLQPPLPQPLAATAPPWRAPLTTPLAATAPRCYSL